LTDFGKGPGAVRRANGIYDISPIQRFFNIVPGIGNRLKSFKLTLAVDAPVILDSFNTFRELFEIKQTNLMPVRRTVECNGTTPVSRTQYSDVHIAILQITYSVQQHHEMKNQSMF
ncbi:MAG: hypothetical protein WBM78_02630, partial [Desulfobacterales bacterium]